MAESLTTEVVVEVNSSQAEASLDTVQQKLNDIQKTAEKIAGAPIGSVLGAGPVGAGAGGAGPTGVLPATGGVGGAGGGGTGLPAGVAAATTTAAASPAATTSVLPATGGCGGAGGGGTGGGGGGGGFAGGAFAAMLGGAAPGGTGGRPPTIGQIRGMPVGVGAGLATAGLSAFAQSYIAQRAAEATPSISVERRKQAADMGMMGTLIGGGVGVALGAVAGLATGGIAPAMIGVMGTMGALGGGNIGGMFGADANLEAAGMDDVQARMFRIRNMKRQLARARGASPATAGGGIMSGFGPRHASPEFRQMVGMGFSSEEVASMIERTSVGAGFDTGISTAPSAMEMLQLQRSGFDPGVGINFLRGFRPGGQFGTPTNLMNNPQSAFPSRSQAHMDPRRAFEAASAMGLTGSGADEFVTGALNVGRTRFGRRGLRFSDPMTMFDESRRMEATAGLGGIGNRANVLQGNLMESGLSVRDRIVNQIGGTFNEMAQFRQLSRGLTSTGSLTGALGFMERTSGPAQRRQQLAALGGEAATFAFAAAGGANMREAQALSNVNNTMAGHRISVQDMETRGATGFEFMADERLKDQELNANIVMLGTRLQDLVDALNTNIERLFNEGITGIRKSIP